MVCGHCQKQQENFESKTCISSTRRRMANCLTGNVHLPLHIYLLSGWFSCTCTTLPGWKSEAGFCTGCKAPFRMGSPQFCLT